jgi:methylated-DNA-[protein]-cysteine S-methyltransferase
VSETRLPRLKWKGSIETEAAKAADAFVERAQETGLIDVAYTEVDSPFGPLLLARTPRGLVRVGFVKEGFDKVLEDLSSRVSPRVLAAPAQLDDVRRQLDEYFKGGRRRFDVPLDWQLSKGFKLGVLRATARIPYGKVATYSQMAEKAGNVHASRAAGNALGSNPIPIVVPCHRVLRTGGNLGGYGGGLEMKEALLRLEGALS